MKEVVKVKTASYGSNTVNPLNSIRRASRIKEITTQRKNELLFDLECNYFYCLDFSDNVIDIREQYPLLSIEGTMLIAKELRLGHPRYTEISFFIIINKK